MQISELVQALQAVAETTLGKAFVALLAAMSTYYTVQAVRLRKSKLPLRRESDARMRDFEIRLAGVEGEVRGIKEQAQTENAAMRREIQALSAVVNSSVGRIEGLVSGLAKNVETSISIAVEALKGERG